ncbi:DUF2120 domain-containing protein [Methanobrevibacter olleyae]|uniref:DUF2120 domain-containing protein n=1 Tax=Methanobrevibacter olleyae TaxID=294671 RepID=A0A126R1M6_METOL|nr:DUF2120 domain-containing protein [Methanobrevibacter olleyae]AMK15968.1 hypothetical protein YLM1_1411 [Methanobrevibacter olleyae]SFL16495.1 hypothetical protein SAMN02910297_00089 [Methanobrevibacter olleyae]
MSEILPKITGQVIGHFNAFKGSRPAYHSEHILIVRGISHDKIELDEMEDKLAELKDILDAREVDVLSDSGKNFVEKVDSYMREDVAVDTAPDSGGLLRMKDQLEAMGLTVYYKLFLMSHAGAFVAIWKDKSGFGPLYVEVTVSERGDTDN